MLTLNKCTSGNAIWDRTLIGTVSEKEKKLR